MKRLVKCLSSKSAKLIFITVFLIGTCYLCLSDTIFVVENQQIDIDYAKKCQYFIPVSAAIKRSSRTYVGYGFENAFNNNSSKGYVAGIEGEKLAYVELELEKLTPLSRISIQWENLNNFARQVRVFQIDGYIKREIKLSRLEKADHFSSDIFLQDTVKIGKLRIEFSDFSGQSRLLLRQIQLYASIVDIAEMSSKQLLSVIYMEATDKGNPLHIFRRPITMFVKKLSDELSVGAQNNHEKIIHFMDYIGKFKVGVASNASPEITIEEKVGACSSFTSTLLALAAAQGMQGRFVNLHNFPENDGHTVAEIYFDNGWHLYDPTFSAFYVSSESDGLPLSFSEIQNGYKVKPRTIHVKAKTYRPSLEAYTGKDIFVKANPQGPIGPKNPMLFPLELTLDKRDRIEKKDFGPCFQGANYIGVAYINKQQLWRLKGLLPGKKYEFLLQPDGLGGDITLEDNKKFLILATLKGGTLIETPSSHELDFTSTNHAPLLIRFTANNPEVTLMLSHQYNDSSYRYVSVRYYQLREIVKEER